MASVASGSTAPAPSGIDTHSSRVDVINTQGGKILCVSDIRGAISTLNKLAAEHSAVAIIHSGDFGFYEPSSLPSISDRTLRHLVQYSSLISPAFRSALLAPNVQPGQMREMLASPPPKLPGGAPGPTVNDPSYFGLSDFPKLLAGEIKLHVPVYTVWGACEDVAVLEKIRLAAPSFLNVPASTEELQAATQGAGEGPAGRSNLTTTYGYSIPNLTVLDEATTRVLLIGGVRLRLFGLGGAVVSHKLFDNGTGNATIAGGGGTMWTTVLQVGELVDTAQKVYDATETRLLVSHASPGREGLLAQLALVLKADLTVSAGLHFRYGVSYNEFSVQPDPEAYRLKLEYAKKGFNEVWDTVKSQVESVVDQNQRVLLNNALAVANRVPPSALPGGAVATEETAWKNCWNWNLPDAAYGSLVLDIRDGRVGSEMRSQGFNFAYRQNKPAPAAATSAPAPNATSTTSKAPAMESAAPRSAENNVATASIPVSTPFTAPKPSAPPKPSASPAPPTAAAAGQMNSASTPNQGPQRGGVHGGRGGFGPGGRGGLQNHNGRVPSNGSSGRGGRSSGQWSSGERSGNEGPKKEREGSTGAAAGVSGAKTATTSSTIKEEGAATTGKKDDAVALTSTTATPAREEGARGNGNRKEGRGPRGQSHKTGGSGSNSSANRDASNAAPTSKTAAPEVGSTPSPASGAGGETSSGDQATAATGSTPSGERGRGGHRGGRGGRGGGRGGRGGHQGGERGVAGAGGAEGGGAASSPSAATPSTGRGRGARNNQNAGGEGIATSGGGESRKAGANGGGW